MTNIRARNLFTAILVARAICGIGVVQADWESVDKTPGPGHTVTGTDVCTNLASYLDVNYNDVTMEAGATSAETLPFRVPDVSNPTADIQGNTLGVGGSVTTTYADGVVFTGYRVNDNMVTVDLSGSITNKLSSEDVTGILFDAWTEASDNKVYNHGSISDFDEGICLQARDTLADNIVFNDGQITGGDIGIHLEGNHISGAGITDSSSNLADSVTNSGAISVVGVGIQLEADEDITDFRVTNTSDGTISSKAGVGIELSAGGDVSDTEIYNAGSIKANYAGVLLGANHVSDNTVVNSGEISADRGGILIRFNDSAENNILTNAGTITTNEIGIGIGGAGDASRNKLANTVDCQISAQVGLGIDTSGTATYNELTNDGSISAEDAGMEISTMGGASFNTVKNTGSIDVSGNDGDLAGILVSGAYGDVAENQVTNANNADDPMNLVVVGITDEESELATSGIMLRSYTGAVYNNTVENNGSIYALTRITDTSGGDSVDIEATANGIVLFSSAGDVGKNSVTSYDVDAIAVANASASNADGHIVLDNETTANGITIYGMSGTVADNTVSSDYVQAVAEAKAAAAYVYADDASFSMDNAATADGIAVYSGSGAVSKNSVTSGYVDVSANAIADVYEVEVVRYEEPVEIAVHNAAAANGISIYSSTGDVNTNIVMSDDLDAHALAQVSSEYTSHEPLNIDNEAASNGIVIYSMSGDVSGNSVTSGHVEASAQAVAEASYAYNDSVTVSNEATSNGITLYSSLGTVTDNQVRNTGSVLAAAKAGATIEMDTSGASIDFDIDNAASASGIALFSMNGDVSGNQVTNTTTIADANAGVDVVVFDTSGGSLTVDNNEATANGIALYSYTGDVLGNVVKNAGGEYDGGILAVANATTTATSGGDLINVNLDGAATANGIALSSYLGRLDGNKVTNDLAILVGATSTVTDTSGVSVNISMDSEASAAGILLYGASGCGEVDLVNHINNINTVSNSGAITATATAGASTTDLSGNLSSTADAVGIGLRSQFGDITGNIVDNTGTITAIATASATATDTSGSSIDADVQARAAGIAIGSYTGDVVGNTVTNSGAIVAQALATQTFTSGGSESMADGIHLYSGTGGFVPTGPGTYGGKLTGNVVTLASASSITSTGDGVHLQGGDTVSGNRVTNAGLISAQDYGIILESEGDDVSGNTVTNAADATLTSGYDDGIALVAGLAVRGNTVTNSGTITLIDGFDGIELYTDGGDVVGNTVSNTSTGVINVPEYGYGISLDSSYALSDNTVSNAGQINAVDMSQAALLDAALPSGVTGIDLYGDDYVRNNKVTNEVSGTIQLGEDGIGISLESDGDVSENKVKNFGAIAAGDHSLGIYLGSDGNNALVNTVENSYGASITVGDRSCGILIEGRGDADGNIVTNAGDITVGNLGTDLSGNIGAGGIVITGAGGIGPKAADTTYNTVSGNTVTNSGDITVNTDMSFGELYAGGIVVGSLGELIDSEFGQDAVTEPTGAVTGNTVTNSGQITVVTSADSSGNVLAGGIMIGNIYERILSQVQGYPATSANTVTNTATGSITMGEDGVGILVGNLAVGYDNFAGPTPMADDSPVYGTFGNTVVNAGHIVTGDDGVGIKFLDDYCISNNTLTNSGDITSGDYGYGVMLDGNRSLTLSSSGNTLTNTGRISVGDWGEGVALWDIDASTVTNFGTIEASVDGTGVDIQGDRNVLTNWGRIRVDAGLLDDASLPDAIYVRGNGNIVNLEGHSSLGETGETGKITGYMTDTSGNVNILNVNFTGLSPEVKADLEEMIAGQVDASGNPLSDTVEFNVRGVDYVVDPMQIHVDLSSYEEEAGTPNQGTIGANLDSLTENPDPGTDLFNLLNAVDESGDIPAALGALSPQGYQLFGDIAVATMSGVTQQIDQRMAFLSEDMPEKRGNLWISGGYKNAKVDADAPDQTKAEFDTNTVVVGADYRVNPNFTIGALFHYSNTDKAKLDTKGSRADVESRGFGVYAGYRQEGIYGNALAVYSSNDYKSTRTVPIPDYSYTAKAKTNGHQLGFGLDGGYDFRISDQLTAGPLAGLQYVRLNVDGFDEKGAYGANLAVDDQTMTSLLGRVGGRLNWNTTVRGNDTFSLDVHAAFQHEFKNDSRDITAAFIGTDDLLGAFSVKTTDPKRNSILVGAGFNYDFHGVASIFANYDAQTGQSNWHEQNVRGGVKISF